MPAALRSRFKSYMIAAPAVCFFLRVAFRLVTGRVA
jgi:hypothetical protein